MVHQFDKEEDYKNYNTICSNFDYYPTVISHKERVIGIGDIHGDMELAIKFLKIAKVIEEVPNKYFKDKQIKEHKYLLKIINNTVEHEINESNFDLIEKQPELIYRYYEVYDSDNKLDDYYVKIIQDGDRWFKWIGGKTYVVQVGDQIDRCRPFGTNTCTNKITTKDDEDSDLAIMLFYDSISKIAKKYNGALYNLLGNHEIMNISGDMRYVSNKGLIEFSPEPKDLQSGYEIRKKVFESVISKKMACTRAMVLIIGDYLFVHGGIANKLAFKYKLLDINQIIRQYLYSMKSNKDIHNLLNSSKLSPLWYRELAYIPPDINGQKDIKCNTLYKPIIESINKTNNPIIKIKGMIIGHTPQFTVFGKGITTACDNNLIRVDIGASKAFSPFDNDINKSAREAQVIELLRNPKTKETTVYILR